MWGLNRKVTPIICVLCPFSMALLHWLALYLVKGISRFYFAFNVFCHHTKECHIQVSLTFVLHDDRSDNTSQVASLLRHKLQLHLFGSIEDFSSSIIMAYLNIFLVRKHFSHQHCYIFKCQNSLAIWIFAIFSQLL